MHPVEEQMMKEWKSDLPDSVDEGFHTAVLYDNYQLIIDILEFIGEDEEYEIEYGLGLIFMNYYNSTYKSFEYFRNYNKIMKVVVNFPLINTKYKHVSKNTSALYKACMRGDEKMVKLMLSKLDFTTLHIKKLLYDVKKTKESKIVRILEYYISNDFSECELLDSKEFDIFLEFNL